MATKITSPYFIIVDNEIFVCNSIVSVVPRDLFVSSRDVLNENKFRKEYRGSITALSDGIMMNFERFTGTSHN
jgi:hypothetical protein